MHHTRDRGEALQQRQMTEITRKTMERHHGGYRDAASQTKQRRGITIDTEKGQYEKAEERHRRGSRGEPCQERQRRGNAEEGQERDHRECREEA
jgi:dihydrodipicolinate reductase